MLFVVINNNYHWLTSGDSPTLASPHGLGVYVLEKHKLKTKRLDSHHGFPRG